MDIVVPIKMVPDLVEELEIAGEGRDLDRSLLKLRISEWDEQAVEEALLWKDQHGARVTVLALDTGDPDETLFTCLAKGADRAIKLTGGEAAAGSSRATADVLAKALTEIPHDLVLAGVQAVDDRDGQVAVFLAEALGLPHVSVVSGVEPAGPRTIVARQEYAGGLMAELEVDLPCVLGIQAAREAPRYAPVGRVRQAMKTLKLETVAAAAPEAGAGSTVRRLAKPDAGGRAEILEGTPEEIVDKLYAILKAQGLVRS